MVCLAVEGLRTKCWTPDFDQFLDTGDVFLLLSCEIVIIESFFVFFLRNSCVNMKFQFVMMAIKMNGMIAIRGK